MQERKLRKICLEMMDQGLHAFLHHRTRGRNEFMIIDPDSTRCDLIQALTNNSQTFPHFLDTAQVAIITIAILAHWDVKFDLDIIYEVKWIFQIKYSCLPRRTYHMVLLSSSPKECHCLGA